MGFEVTGYQDYMRMMETFTRLTGRDDLYQNQAALVSEPIEETIARAQNHPDYQKKTALLLRAWSSGVRAKGSDNLAGYMLRDMGLINIADGHSLMENLTLEAILAADPDYIFITVMGGSEEQALSYLDETLMKNPAWQGLSAVKEGHVSVLDRTLFHLKPNARWAQAYESLYTLLYEEPS